MYRGNRNQNRRGRQNNRVFGFRRNFITPNQLRRDFQGYIPRGPFDPPRVVANPWNSVVLSTAGTDANAGPTTLTVSAFKTVLQNQLGLSSDVFIRFIRVSVWSSVTDLVAGQLNLALQPSHLQSLTRAAEHQWIEDIGTPARPANVHFVWPRNESDFVFNTSSDGAYVIVTLDHGANFSYYLHIHVLWRPIGGDPIPTRFLQAAIVELD